MNRAEIIATFDRIEAERGGLANADTALVIDLTARALGLERATVRDVLTDHWLCRGGG